MTTTLTLPATEPGLTQAAALLRQGQQVAFPTETVYGLGADARSDQAVAGIYAAKNRPSFNPLIIHLPDLDVVARYARLPALAKDLAESFWPGPLTLVLPLRPDGGISKLVTAGLDTIAVRVPDAPLAQQLLTAFDGPVAAPSANPSGRISPTTAAHVLSGLSGRIAAVLDGGPCGVGVESTILDVSGPVPRLLRPGGLAHETLEAHLKQPLAASAPDPEDSAPLAPGQLSSHYAPRAPVRLNATALQSDEVLLGFGPVPNAVENLSVTGDLREATANLFAALHRLDASGAQAIAVSPIPETGLGLAINDRLRRAAAPRPN